MFGEGEMREERFKSKQRTITVHDSKIYLFLKRLIDILGSLFGILICMPAFLIIACIIKLQDGGPIIFKQRRVGKRGNIFDIYKFRSMQIDAEVQKNSMLDQNEIEGAMFKIRNDPRVTKFGRFIRKTSLDELPQFFNILLGDMSLVGPRPPLLEEVEIYSDYDKQRLLVTPGLSGLWQISGRNNLSFDEMVYLDLKYIQTRSLLLDIKIIVMTLWNMLTIKKNGAF
ncbi:sugar transferase [Leuconostoc citreum]|uniref:sugar transferase n=1 Tax=Leuconostoc citreum TaxID=33964 RepID=UPI00288B469E|nr:sugar transferase [Leuconostoc citreum]MCT3075010.1 sugar transferase [Leuconostoc citreum]